MLRVHAIVLVCTKRGERRRARMCECTSVLAPDRGWWRLTLLSKWCQVSRHRQTKPGAHMTRIVTRYPLLNFVLGNLMSHISPWRMSRLRIDRVKIPEADGNRADINFIWLKEFDIVKRRMSSIFCRGLYVRTLKFFSISSWLWICNTFEIRLIAISRRIYIFCRNRIPPTSRCRYRLFCRILILRSNFRYKDIVSRYSPEAI